MAKRWSENNTSSSKKFEEKTIGKWRVNLFLFLLLSINSVIIPWFPLILQISGLSYQFIGVSMALITVSSIASVKVCLFLMTATHSGGIRRLLFIFLLSGTLAMQITSVMILPVSQTYRSCADSVGWKLNHKDNLTSLEPTSTTDINIFNSTAAAPDLAMSSSPFSNVSFKTETTPIPHWSLTSQNLPNTKVTSIPNTTISQTVSTPPNSKPSLTSENFIVSSQPALLHYPTTPSSSKLTSSKTTISSSNLNHSDYKDYDFSTTFDLSDSKPGHNLPDSVTTPIEHTKSKPSKEQTGFHHSKWEPKHKKKPLEIFRDLYHSENVNSFPRADAGDESQQWIKFKDKINLFPVDELHKEKLLQSLKEITLSGGSKSVDINMQNDRITKRALRKSKKQSKSNDTQSETELDLQEIEDFIRNKIKSENQVHKQHGGKYLWLWVTLLLIGASMLGSGLEPSVARLWHCYSHGYHIHYRRSAYDSDDLLERALTDTFELSTCGEHYPLSRFICSCVLISTAFFLEFGCQVNK